MGWESWDMPTVVSGYTSLDFYHK